MGNSWDDGGSRRATVKLNTGGDGRYDGTRVSVIKSGARQKMRGVLSYDQQTLELDQGCYLTTGDIVVLGKKTSKFSLSDLIIGQFKITAVNNGKYTLTSC